MSAMLVRCWETCLCLEQTILRLTLLLLCLQAVHQSLYDTPTSWVQPGV